MPRFRKRPEPSPAPDRAVAAAAGRGGAPTIAAELTDGPLGGRTVQAEAVEGRPPKTIDVDAADGGTCRYCLAQWTQSGGSAAYTFLYRL